MRSTSSNISDSAISSGIHFLFFFMSTGIAETSPPVNGLNREGEVLNMEFDSSEIEFSQNDVKKKVILPDKMNEDLAEILGIVIGDGSVMCKTTGYRVTISGSNKDINKYFKPVVIPKFQSLFNIKPYIHSQRTNEVNLVYFSKALALFFRNILQVPANKKDVKIPSFMLEMPLEIQTAMIRGLFDTDGHIALRRKYKQIKYYPSIGFASKSKNLIVQLECILPKFGVTITSYKTSYFDKRCNETHFGYKIDINGKKNTIRWMEKVGFSNISNLDKYKRWKNKYGPAED